MKNVKILSTLIALVPFMLGSAVGDDSGNSFSRANGDAYAWKASEGGNDHVYQAVVTKEGSITWKEAKARASARGGHLATVTSEQEYAFVVDLVRHKRYWNRITSAPFRYYGPWMGGFQEEDAKEPDGGWKWVTGEDFKWLTGDGSEPNNFWNQSDENRIQLFYIGEKRLTDRFIEKFKPKWNDVPAEGQGGVSCFIIEWDRNVK